MEIIHYFAKRGKINELRKKLKEDPDSLEVIDKDGWTPLFYAASAKRKAAVRLLLRFGADTAWSDIEQKNIIEIAKHNGKHNSVSRYIKSKIGLSEAEKIEIETTFRGFAKTAFRKAKQSDKKLLVLLGESHGVFRVYQVEKIILKVLSEFGLSHIGLEDNDVKTCLAPIDLYAKNKLKMKLHAIDHPDRETVSNLERDIFMSTQINKSASDSAVIVGGKHLKGLLERIDLNTYHVLPLNLSGCYKNNLKDSSSESQFSYDKQKVIQLRGSIFTDAKAVSAKWNEKAKTVKTKKVKPK